MSQPYYERNTFGLNNYVLFPKLKFSIAPSAETVNSVLRRVVHGRLGLLENSRHDGHGTLLIAP
ncbi:hypothetical protein LIA77_11531 [Sarocladium implicatum]|nr:hypothetical protein LIA77_11531 [Sarocladium implicatum]